MSNSCLAVLLGSGMLARKLSAREPGRRSHLVAENGQPFT